MKFIISRTDDYKSRSKKWIIGYGLLFWLISRIVAMLLMTASIALYNAFGINPEAATKFVGDPETAKTLGSLMFVLATVCIIAPLLEECIFRLGLSFKKWQVALGVASIPAYILWQIYNSLSFVAVSLYIIAIAAAFFLVYYLTTDAFWERLKEQYYKPAIWISTIAFGLIHLIAFSDYSLTLLPYMLCVISVPFFAGCAITYYRINLGFWWGVGLHIFNNIPAVFVMLSN